MTLKELRNKISDSSNHEKFKNLTVKLTYNYLDIDIPLEGIGNIYRYFKKQKKGWSRRKNNDLPNVLQSSKGHFVQLTKQIENFISRNEEANDRQFQRNWQSLKSNLRSQNTVSDSKSVFTYDASGTDFLVEVYHDYPNAFGGAFQFITTPDGQNINRNISPGVLKGYILAYEFRLQDHTEIQQRRNNEKISLGHIRGKYEDYLQQAEKDLQDTIKETKDSYDKYVQAIDELEKAKEESFDKWFGKSKQDFTSFHEGAKEEAKDLREVYREGLRFAGPVRYWEKRALEMKKNGGM